MVQLSPTPDLCHHGNSPDHMGCLNEDLDEGEFVEQTEVYPGYEGYIENGLICLKHKVRNLEKKKLKLEDYKLRLKRGHVLNKDQVASVEKYEEVLHHLSLAQELHQTLDSFSQNLLRAQKKAVKKQQLQSRESERRRLCSVLQFQKVLRCLDRDKVQADLLSGLNEAPKVPAQTLQSLRELRPLLGLSRDHTLTVEEQMLKAAELFLDLVDGKETPVVDSTFAVLKEELCVLVLSPYFDSLPPQEEQCEKNSGDADASKSESPDLPQPERAKPQRCSDPDPVASWDSNRELLKDQEPPDHWDSDFADPAPDKSLTVGKRWREGASLVLKNQPGGRRSEEAKRKEKKTRRVEPFKPCEELLMPMEVLTLPTDPELRRQRLEELLININGAFSFVQDSVLDGDDAPSATKDHKLRRASGCPSPPLAQSDPRHLSDPRPVTLQSSPLFGGLLDRKPSLTNGDPELGSQDMELTTCCDTLITTCLKPSVSPVGHKQRLQSPVTVKPSLSRTPPTAQSFTTPPSRRVLSPHFNNMSAVFKVNPSLPPTDFSQAEHRPRRRSISTQTPPEFEPSDDDVHEAGWSDMSLVSSIELEPRDSGHGDTLTTPSSSVSAPLLPLPLHEAPPSTPVLPPYPLRVAFSAVRTVNFAPGNLDQPIVFDQLHCNVGEMYDPRIGTFTCPVDGTYAFHFHILKLAINVPLYVNLMRNEEVMVSAYANDDAPDHETATNHAVLPLFRGDQVWLRLHRGAIYGSTWKYTTFSGYLLYQD